MMKKFSPGRFPETRLIFLAWALDYMNLYVGLLVKDWTKVIVSNCEVISFESIYIKINLWYYVV